MGVDGKKQGWRKEVCFGSCRVVIAGLVVRFLGAICYNVDFRDMSGENATTCVVITEPVFVPLFSP